MAYLISTLVVVRLAYIHQLSQSSPVLRVDLLKGESCASLAPDYSTQSCLAFDNAVWHTHFTAESRHEKHHLQ